MLEFNSNAARFLWDTAASAGDAPAIRERDVQVTYAELRERAGAVAQALLGSGVAANEPVGALLERGPDAAAVLFGIFAAGGIAVLMDEILLPRQIEHILTHSGARRLISSAGVLARHPRGLAVDCEILEAQQLFGRGEFVPVSRLQNDVAQIIYTSGSTGLPKGVTVSHGNLDALTTAVNSYLDIAQSDRIASLLPFSFVYGLGQLLCSVKAGATLVIERSPLPAQIVDGLRAQQVTVLAGVPSIWSRLLATPTFRDQALPDLRVLTNAGGHLRVDLVRALRRSQPHGRLFLMYGLTEAMRCTYLSPEDVDRHPDSIGRAIPGAQVMVIKEDGSAAAPGEVGELVHRGPTVTLGYWRDPGLTARVFKPHPLRAAGAPDAERVVYTGDLVRADAEGLLYFVGRQDRIIKTMGYRVSPDEVIAVLHASGEISEGAVVPQPDPQWGAVLVAHVVLVPDGSLARLNAYCARELPRYLRPSRIVVRESMPLTPNGKQDYAALKAATV